MYIPEQLIYATELAKPMTAGPLFLWPVLLKVDQAPPALTLAEALETGKFQLREIGDDGRVGELLAVNGLEVPVFLLDGEQCLGVKQNRAFNLSMLIPPQTNVAVPVSCLERGRWAPTAAPVRAAEHVHFASGRGAKMRSVSESLALLGVARADQDLVWSEIDARIMSEGVHAGTSAEAALYEGRKDDVGTLVRNLEVLDRQAGFVFGIGKRLMGFDLFGSSDLYRRLHDKLIQGLAMEAIFATGKASPGSADDAMAFLKRVDGQEHQGFPSPGAGETIRWSLEGFTAAAVIHKDTCLHITGFQESARR